MAPARLFLALWPTPRQRKTLRAHQHAWSWGAGASLVLPEKLHLTLHFLGDIERARVAELAVALEVNVEAIELVLDLPRLWPHGVAVLQAGETPQALGDLRARLGKALQALQVPTETRAYRPHVTLARRAEGAVPPGQACELHWRVAGYALVESMRDESGTYKVVRRYPVENNSEETAMKYEVIVRGPRLEAIGAHSGYRIRMSTLAAKGLDTWPVTVHVRGSESEDEVLVTVPHRHHASATEALDHGYDCATLWIDAMDHRLG